MARVWRQSWEPAETRRVKIQGSHMGRGKEVGIRSIKRHEPRKVRSGQQEHVYGVRPRLGCRQAFRIRDT